MNNPPWSILPPDMPVSTPRTTRKAASKKAVSRNTTSRKTTTRKAVSRKTTSRKTTSRKTTAPRKSARKKETINVVLEEQTVVSRRRPRAQARARATVQTNVEATTKVNRRKSRREDAVLPSWRDLDRITNGRVVAPKSHPFDSISTARIALIILLVGASVTAYVGHVHATQGVLGELQSLRAEGSSLRLEFNSIRGEYDRLTGPAAIRHAARDLGLVENTTFGEPLIIED